MESDSKETFLLLKCHCLKFSKGSHSHGGFFEEPQPPGQGPIWESCSVQTLADAGLSGVLAISVSSLSQENGLRQDP